MGEFHFDIRKRIVAEAGHSGSGIAIEDLRGIQERVQAGRRQRAVLLVGFLAVAAVSGI
jgi:hypothetical protein